MRYGRTLVPLALACALLAGCETSTDKGGAPATPAPVDNGVAALEPAAILAKARAALNTVKSYSVKGEVTAEKTQIKFDVKISGKDVFGTVGIGDGSIELLRVEDAEYVRPDEKVWTQSAGDAGSAMAQLLGDRWARLSEKNNDFSTFFQIADPAELLKADGNISRGDVKMINGVKAIGLVDNGAEGGVLYVATTGEPYPMLLEGPSGQGQLTFGDFGATFNEIKAPDATKIVDLDKLLKK